MIGAIPTPDTMDPWDADPSTQASWRERERRQRTVRLLMMFLLMLLLMDGEEQSARRRSNDPNYNLRKRKNGKKKLVLEQPVYNARRDQEDLLTQVTRIHPRFTRLLEMQDDNSDESKTTVDSEKKFLHYPWNSTGFYRGEWIRESDEEGEEKVDDEPNLVDTPQGTIISTKKLESVMMKRLNEFDETIGVFLLPQGSKVKMQNYNATKAEEAAAEAVATVLKSKNSGTDPWLKWLRVGQPELDEIVASALEENEPAPQVTLTKGHGRAACQFYSRPVPGMKELSLVDGFVKLYDSNTVGYSTRRDILLRVRGVLIHAIGRLSLVSNAAPGRSALIISDQPTKEINTQKLPILEEETDQRRRRLSELLVNINAKSDAKELEMVRDHVLHLFPADEFKVNEEWTLTQSIDPELSLANSNEPSIISHMIGLFQQKLTQLVPEKELIHEKSLMVNGGILHSFYGLLDVFRRSNGKKVSTRRRLSQSIGSEKLDTTNVSGNHTAKNISAETNASISMDQDTLDIFPTNATNLTSTALLKAKGKNHSIELRHTLNASKYSTAISRRMDELESDVLNASLSKNISSSEETSKFVIPFPYVPDDDMESIRKAKTPAARRMPAREQLLEANAGRCEFEINLDVKEIEWTLGEWKTLISQQMADIKSLDPSLATKEPEEGGNGEEEEDKIKTTRSARKAALKNRQDQALVMAMNGSIHSPNCDFISSLNVTAIRTDWEHTTGKAINYSFYMMLTCLTQIVVLLRQLLHTQHQSTATRVSLLCIGWQTVLDALLCLGHIYLSLAMQPLFTAFASVAFFKLLIFCVIEMKYMAIIIQARNNANGGQSTHEVLRRQVAMLHLRFYVALIGAFLAFFYAGQQYRTIYIVGLYSFWVPQIIQNIISEAKRPLHVYYIYGMSISRCVAPLYMFAVPNNFLKEVYPDSPTNYVMVEILIVWIAIQNAVLIAQSKYGARFMIPARFLPPKFDYHRAIPPSLLPPEAEEQDMKSEQVKPSTAPTLQNESPEHTTTGTRNRLKKKNGSQEHVTTTMTTEAVEVPTPALDCVICCNGIDHHNQKSYMLAPCEHIFHKDCLIQWMDVKMECPTCRTELPAI
mmetsp:Transcript_26034/g.38480  ORF Transcript_26034/g.38480 Transcript_26034/m.38480 type:complete len:1100 (+) Transcript_26034:250-3549(+)|eukprot:CAMPEP_0194209054 /NCGR_PEP_ID=MMETSP0156-20130528/7313_1 /TAXON_ID=33649 /ORGANISM="Thalassionema nitzschioides, Strain L26-B" /LENGTH=1099 /DNA_ID=CAMNT_0038936147 /DNA_START=214 /DNA_END=3513 /DNA_ORIENTATION=+